MKMPYDDGCPHCEAPLTPKPAGRLSWLTCTKCPWTQRFEAVAVSSHQSTTEAR